MLSYILVLSSILAVTGAAVTDPQVYTNLSLTQIESFRPYSLYAAAAYCQPSKILSWSCGGPYLFSVI
jgi:hypothetical protein